MPEKEMLILKVWAVVGANQNREKYGNMIYRKLLSRGYETYPVNPMYEEIEGDTCYKDLSSLPVRPDAINIVVSPERARVVVDEAARLGVKNLWFQPGTHTPELLNYARSLGLECVTACILVATR
jgi:predicted CoA-binding protein